MLVGRNTWPVQHLGCWAALPSCLTSLCFLSFLQELIWRIWMFKKHEGREVREERFSFTRVLTNGAEAWAVSCLPSAHCHSKLCSVPAKHQGTTGVKIPALITFVWERNTRRLHLNQYGFCFCLQRRGGKKFWPQVQLGDLIWIYTGEIEKKGSRGGWASVTTTGSWRGWSCITCKVCSSQTCSATALLLISLLSDPPWLVKGEVDAAFCCQVSFLLI